MATNPDFTKLNLEAHPSCDYDQWKASLESETGKKYDDLYDTTLERIPVGPLYTQDVYKDCNHLDFMSGIPPFLRGPQEKPGSRPERSVHCIRPSDPPRLRCR